MAQLLTDAESAYRSGLDETRAWEALRLRLAFPDSQRPRARRRYARTLVTCAVAAAVVILGWSGWAQYRLRVDAARVQALKLKQPAPAIISQASIRLAPGKSQLADGTLVELTQDAQGTLVADTRGSTLQFDHGRLDIHVAHQLPGHSFAVKTRDVEFVVLGTRFSVIARESQVTLDVMEGKVLVKSAAAKPVTVQAGGHWSNSEQPPAIALPSTSVARSNPSSPPAAPDTSRAGKVNDVSSCRDHLRNAEPQLAEECYLEVAAGRGLSAEMALYEVARLRRDVLSNSAAALAALDAYEARFASGTLAPEVRIARVDLLSRLGRFDEALKVSEMLLASPVGSPRATELRLLRGNLLRDKKHDCAAALSEYQRIQSDPGPRGEQAEFAAAGCLERLGRATEAIETYEHYLGRARPGQAAQARQRLLKLTQ